VLGALRLWGQGTETLEAGNGSSGAEAEDTGSGAEADDTGSEAGDGGFEAEYEGLRPLDGLSTSGRIQNKRSRPSSSSSFTSSGLDSQSGNLSISRRWKSRRGSAVMKS
jgi:hypothetical protein